jgi:microcystin-dependent protein
MTRLAQVADLANGDPVPESWVDDVRLIANYLGIAGADLASAGTISIDSYLHKVTGSTTIDNITDALGAITGQRVKLLFQAQIAVRHIGGGTGNIRLVGGIHAGFVANEALELTYDGAHWVETHRTPLHLSGHGGIVHNSTTIPTGYVSEDGSAISRTTFAALFANIGTTFGAGDGSTTFNLPDSRGRMDVGHAASGGHADVSTIANSDGIVAANRRPKHQTTSSLSGSFTGSGGNTGLVSNDHTHGFALFVSGTGGGSPNIPAGDNSGTPAADGIAQTGGISANHSHAFTPAGSVSLGGSIGTNNANDAADAPAYLVRPKTTRV